MNYFWVFHITVSLLRDIESGLCVSFLLSISVDMFGWTELSGSQVRPFSRVNHYFLSHNYLMKDAQYDPSEHRSRYLTSQGVIFHCVDVPGTLCGRRACVQAGRFDMKMSCLTWCVCNGYEGTDPEQHTQHVFLHDWIVGILIIWWLQRGYTQTIVLSCKTYQYFRNFDFITHLTVMSVCKQVCIGTVAW